MCFSRDGVGRINFGDVGGPGQSQTPFIHRTTHPTYNVSFTAINVESKSVAAEFTAVMDSGTSFTYLNDPEYTELATNFNSQIREKRANFSSDSSDVPFEYCYGLSSEQTEVLLPEVSLTTKGGDLFPVTRSIIVFADETNGKARAIGYCLAVIKNDIPINIIGQNFMNGLKVVFNREKSVLSWQKFDCYKNAAVADAPEASPSPSPAPASPRPTPLTPQQDANNRYPGAAPVPTSSASRNAARALLLPLLVAAAAIV
ncbi:unnamed protein product [Urochloa humidicola]